MRQSRRAFTLIESAVGAALFLLIVGIAMSIFSQAPTDEAAVGQKLDLFAEARRAYFDMTEELKLGTEILQPSISGTTPFIMFTNVTYEIIGYYVRQSPTSPNKRELCRINFNSPDQAVEILCDKVRELKFTRKGRREIAVRMLLSDEAEEGGPSKRPDNVVQLVNSVTLRNTLNAL